MRNTSRSVRKFRLRWLLAASVVLLPFASVAKTLESTGAPGALTTSSIPAGTAPYTTPGCLTATAGALVGCTSVSAPSVNVTTPGIGLQFSGLNGLRETTASSATGLLAGPYTAPNGSANAFLTSFGAYNLESLNAGVNESSTYGMGAAIAITTGGAFSAFGVGAGSGETTQGAWIAIGDTTMRDVWDANGMDTVVGTGSYTDGAGTNPETIFGQGTFGGNAGTVTFGGTFTTGDVLTFSFSSSNACNGSSITINCTIGVPSSVQYTVPAGATAASVASAVAPLFQNANSSGIYINYILGDGVVEGSHNLYAFSASVNPSPHTNVIYMHFPSSWQITTTYSCSGTCGETATITGATSGGHNNLFGQGIMSYRGVSTAAYNAILGDGDAYLATTASFNSILGITAGQDITSDTFETLTGYESGGQLNGGSENTFSGGYAGYGAINGQKNSIFGSQASGGNNCITTGSTNLELGAGACVVSPTANNQISIANTIYNNSAAASIASGFGTSPTAPTETGDATFHLVVGTGGTASTGVLTFANAAPHGWACSANDETTTSSTVFMTKQTGHTATTATFTQYAAAGTAAAWTAGDTITFRCSGY